jgi:hypothetical protein
MKSYRVSWIVPSLLAVVAMVSGLLVSAFAEGLKPGDVTPEIAAARAKLLGAIPLTQAGAFEAKPNGQGDYVYEASSAKAMLDGAAAGMDPNFKIGNDQFLKGLTLATIDQHGVPLGIQARDGMYWKLGDVQAGKYYVGLVYRSDQPHGTGQIEGPANFTALYLNGRIIQCSTLSDPVQIAPGVWFAEQQAAAAEPLKAGDEITVTPTEGCGLTVARLVLHAKEPARGAFRTYTNFEGFYSIPYTALRITAQCDFMGKDGKPAAPENPWWGHQQQAKSADDFLRDPSGKALAICQVANPLPVPLTIDYQCTIRSHYLKVVAQDSEKLTLQPHQRVTRKIAFETIADEPAYSMQATLKAVNPPDLGWPEADTISYFPGLRQSVPWPDPFNNKYHRRVFFTDPVQGDRKNCILNGEWELAYTPETTPAFPVPAEMKFEKLNVPFNSANLKIDKLTPRAHGGYFRRSFDVPAEIAAGSCRLVIKEIVSAATVYVNGKNVGGLKGECTPVVVDVSGALKAGTNEVVVVLQDLLAIMDPAYINAKNPVLSPLYLDAPGLNGSDSLRLGDVSLETSPAVCAQDVLVIPSYRNKSLGANMTVANHGGKDANLVVKAVVTDGQKDVFELGQKELTVKNGESAAVAFDKPWADAHLYSPQDPFLYVLAVTVTDKDTGKTLDLDRERFGFRECWIEGPNIYYNGHVAKLKGTTGACALGIEADFQLNRGATAPDYQDEIGLPCSEMVTGIFNTPSKHNVERDPFWESGAKNMLVAVKREQNHPCIIAWDLSNEWYCFLPYCGADMKKGAERLENLSAVLAKQDPTRWTWYDGDGDLWGLHNNYAGHYIAWAMQPPISGYNLDGHTPVLPDTGFWRPLNRDFQPGEKIRFSQFYEDNFFILWGQKVVMNTENLWKVGGCMPPGFTKLLGDEDVLSPAMDNSGPAAWFWKNNLEGHRDMGTSSVSSYMLSGATRRGYMLQTFIMPDTVHHGFSGKTLTEKYDILNDRYAPADLTFTWSLIGPDGKPAAGGKDQRQMPACGIVRDGVLSFKLPAVDKRTNYVLDLRLTSADKLVYGEQRDIEVWPDAPASTLVKTSRPIVLFDPTGKTADVFKAAAIMFQPAKEIAAPAGSAVFVIGEGALDKDNAASVAKLDEFVAGGGRVLVLAQTVPPVGLPAATRIDPREWSSMPFVRAGNHPILEGITSWDLHFWAPDRVVARGAYNKPDGGPAVTLIDSGSEIGLEWVQMMELYRGTGSYILCQLPLAGSFNDEPMARELLGRTLSYLGSQELFVTPAAKLQVLTKTDGPVHNALRKAGIAFDLAKSDAAFDAKSIVLVDAATKPADEQVAAWAKAIQGGATFVVSGATPDDAAWLTKLAGRLVQINVPLYHQWAGRGYRVGYDKLTAGLSHCDEYFKRYDGSEPAGGQAEEPSLALDPFQDFAVSAGDAKELVFPGAMVEIKNDQGRLIVDERHWMADDSRILRYAQRNLTSLALGLGVQIAPVATPRELPKDVVYTPIDLTAFANRSLVDDVADDGKGGWSDQGPDADLRTFPTGKQTFQGVPFNIDKDKSCIVLASSGRPGFKTMPKEVTIPMGQKVEGLYFLHSAAYSGNVLTGLYQIQYDDKEKTTFDIPLVGEENIRDWACTPGPLLREKGTQSNVAWTGKCKMFPSISVYRMLWVNPKPDVPIKAVRFSNPSLEPVPILMAMTAALAKGQSNETPKNLADIRDLLNQAGKFSADNKDKDAIELVKKAVAIDPTQTTSQQALADLYEKSGDEDSALAAYQAWVQAGAATPLPYNRLGEIMEKRKDYKAALDFYTKSLKVEWNQPPIIEAKKRLEGIVNK